MPTNTTGETGDKSGSGYQNEHQKNEKSDDGEYLADSKQDGYQAGEKDYSGDQQEKPKEDQSQGDKDSVGEEKESSGSKQADPPADNSDDSSDDSSAPEESDSDRRPIGNNTDLQYFGTGRIERFSQGQKIIKLKNMNNTMALDPLGYSAFRQNRESSGFLNTGTVVSLFGVVRGGRQFVTIIDYNSSQDFLQNQVAH